VAGLIAARSEAEFLEVNRGGTHRLLDAATTVAVRRFVLLSSLSAGGPSPVDRPLTGNEEARPVTAYGRSKLAGESVVRSGALPWTILRPPAVYGPADREMLRVFRAVWFGVAPVFGNGSQRLSLIFGPDLAQAIVAAGTSEGTRSGIYYPAHSEILTGREVVLTIARAAERRVRILPVPQIVARGRLALTAAVAALANRATILNPDKANEFFQSAWTCDPTSLTATTGWRAEYDFAAGARATLEWYRTGGWL
jgi:nucleoside-diphosphate-sugar epimerase